MTNKKTFNKLISLILAVLMLVCLMPLSETASADTALKELPFSEVRIDPQTANVIDFYAEGNLNEIAQLTVKENGRILNRYVDTYHDGIRETAVIVTSNQILEDGTHTFEVSAPGYETKEYTLNFTREKYNNYILNPYQNRNFTERKQNEKGEIALCFFPEAENLNFKVIYNGKTYTNKDGKFENSEPYGYFKVYVPIQDINSFEIYVSCEGYSDRCVTSRGLSEPLSNFPITHVAIEENSDTIYFYGLSYASDFQVKENGKLLTGKYNKAQGCVTFSTGKPFSSGTHVFEVSAYGYKPTTYTTSTTNLKSFSFSKVQIIGNDGDEIRFFGEHIPFLTVKENGKILNADIVCGSDDLTRYTSAELRDGVLSYDTHTFEVSAPGYKTREYTTTPLESQKLEPQKKDLPITKIEIDPYNGSILYIYGSDMIQLNKSSPKVNNDPSDSDHVLFIADSNPQVFEWYLPTSLAEGTHTFKISADGYNSKEFTATFKKSSELKEFQFGEISFGKNLGNRIFFIGDRHVTQMVVKENGKVISKSSKPGVSTNAGVHVFLDDCLSDGTHTFEVSAPGYRTKEYTVTFKRKKLKSVVYEQIVMEANEYNRDFSYVRLFLYDVPEFRNIKLNDGIKTYKVEELDSCLYSGPLSTKPAINSDYYWVDYTEIDVPIKNPNSFKITVTCDGYDDAIVTQDGISTSNVKSPSAPSKVNTPNLATGSKYIKVTWKKTKCSGYQIQIARNKKFTTNKKTYKISNTTQQSKKITGLTNGKTYYIRVRAYNTKNGQTKYGKWSTIKSKKVKK